MTNPFGGFVHTSPLSSLPHEPCITLVSNCIRDTFGPTVQTVADCLQSRGTSTLSEIVTSIRNQCRRGWNEERERLVENLMERKRYLRPHRARGPESSGYVVDLEPIRAALLVLIHHSIVAVKQEIKRGNKEYQYSLEGDRARLLPRYPRYVEYAKKTVDENGAAVVEELLVNGRMRAQEAIEATMETIVQSNNKLNKDRKLLKGVADSFVRMVDGGYIEQVDPIVVAADDKETEFEEEEPPVKKRKTPRELHQSCGAEQDAIVSLLNSSPYRNRFPPGAVWRVNVHMFHDSLRAFCLGRLVAERYGHKVQSAGSMVTAALRYTAHQDHAVKRSQSSHEQGVFSTTDILPYLPAPVRKMLEEKPGGAVSNLSKSLVELSRYNLPPVVVEVEDAEGHPEGGKFQVAIMQLVEHLKGRVLHQVILDSQGEVAARICSYLQAEGHQESDAIAVAALVPTKDVREVLHQLYRANYICLLSLQQSKQYNPSNAIYLWSVDRPRMLQAVTNNVTKALFHIRLRRQHEMEVGKDWIERAKEEAADENDHELDKANYNKFCKGLERLDNAALQLDETLMVLKDF